MGQFFDTVQLPDWTQINSLFSPDRVAMLHNQALASDTLPDAAQANLLIAQNQGASGTQDLADRGTLRQNQLLLAQRDPTALATAASLPGVGGVNTLNALTARDTGIGQLNLDQAKLGLTMPQFPFGRPGINGQVAPAASGSTQPASGATGPVPGEPPGLSGSESGNNSGAVNKQGYSGNLQFGTGRLTDLGMYQPAQGENPNGNQWAGTIAVPGFGQMSHQQFLANPDAQRMAAEVHFKDIGQQIDNTPGADKFDRNGLAAVAHLGGIHGMQQFVATNGAYNPHDSNGTSLQNYYTKFSQGGMPALKNAFGHPDGPLPADHPARGVQTASAANTTGMPATATDAAPISGVDGNPAPGSTPSDTPAQLQAKIAQLRSNVAAGTDPANQAAVDPAYTASMQAPTPGMGMPAPQAVAQARQELDASLQGATPEAYNAAIQGRALQIINQTRQHQGSPALTTPVASSAQQTSAVPIAPSAASAPPPVPAVSPSVGPASQNSLAPVQGQPGPAPQPQAAGGFPTPPAGAQYVRVGGRPVMLDKDYAQIQYPNGQTDRLRVTPPEASRIQVKNPDGSTTVLDTQGHPLYQSSSNTRDIQAKDYEADRNSVTGLADAANTAQTDQIRLQHALTLAGTLRTGANGGSRAEWANLAETYLPSDLAKQFSTSLVGNGGAQAAQQFDKLMVQSAGSQERGVLGARGGYQATQLFMKANPGLNMQGSANQDILNMQLIGKQADADYAQGAVAHFNDHGDAFRAAKGDYVPLTKYDQQWLSQRNPQIYAAAMGAATGQPFAKWTEGLNTKSPDDIKRVIDIVRRAKPNSQIQFQGAPHSVGTN